MRRTRKSYLFALLTVVVALLVSTWGTGVSLAQMDHDDDHDDDHSGTTAPPGGGGGDLPPGPPPANRNPGEQRTTKRYGPLSIPPPPPGQHHGHTGNQFRGLIEKPCSNCQVTSMTAALVNAQGQEVGNPQNLQLHHMVLLQGAGGGRDDATCGSGANWQPTFGNFFPFGLLLGGERFFASGDERTSITAPVGYGFPVTGSAWTLIYELANGNSSAQSAYIEMTYDYVQGNTLADLDPVWMDISQCGFSTMNVPAGNHMRSYTWNVTRPGHVIAAGGHQHGNWVNGAVDGGTKMDLRIGGATGQSICTSTAGYNTSPFYKDGHGMVWLESMSKCGGDAGQAYSLGEVSSGQQMTITSNYEHQTGWPGQMGIMIMYISETAPTGGGGTTTTQGGGGTTTTQGGGGTTTTQGGGGTTTTTQGGGGGGCTPSSTSDYAGEGPFDTTTENLTNHTIFHPTQLGSSGCGQHPVVLWGNGTLAPTGIYAAYLEHLASHGFIVVAGNSTFAGNGDQMLDGLDIIEERNGQSSSPFYQKVSDQVGTTGHSQGGGASIQSGKDPRVEAIFPFEPWLQNQIGLSAVSLFLGGQNDNVVSPATVRARYTGVGNSIPAAYAELAGASHFTALNDMAGFRGPTTAFARWQLMGDGGASSLFLGSGCGLCSNPQWSEFETNQSWQQLGSGGPGTTGPGGGGQCVTATNSQHRDAGRAEGFLILTAVGSGDNLGLWLASTSLSQTSPGTWTRVNSC